MTTRAPLIFLRPVSFHYQSELSRRIVCAHTTRTQEQKSFRELFQDVVQSRTATVERISHFEQNVDEHTKRAHYYKEQAQELKSNLANMDAYLAEAWAVFEKSQHRVRPKASGKRSWDDNAYKVS